MLDFNTIDETFRATVEDLKNRDAEGTDVGMVMLAYASNILLQTEGRDTAALLALQLTELLRNGSGFVHLKSDRSGFACKRGTIDAATPVAGEA